MPKPTILDDELVDEIQTLAASGFIQRSIAYACRNWYDHLI